MPYCCLENRYATCYLLILRHACIHAYIHPCMHTCMHTYIHTYMIGMRYRSLQEVQGLLRGEPNSPVTVGFARQNSAGGKPIHVCVCTVCVCVCMNVSSLPWRFHAYTCDMFCRNNSRAYLYDVHTYTRVRLVRMNIGSCPCPKRRAHQCRRLPGVSTGAVQS